MENYSDKNSDILKDAENLVRPNSVDTHFTHDSIENLFEEFCNATYFFNATFFKSEKEETEAKELAEPHFNRMKADKEFGSLFIAILGYFDSLTQLRINILEYNSYPKINKADRDIQLGWMTGWVEDVSNRFYKIESLLKEKDLDKDFPVLINNLKMLADKWRPERRYTSAEGGTWRDYWKTFTSFSSLFAFERKRSKKSP
jgi:hypothetical protein